MRNSDGISNKINALARSYTRASGLNAGLGLLAAMYN